MLTITIPGLGSEEWDEINEEFVYNVESEETVLHLEHSLVALSKWESKWHKPFLGCKDMTEEMTLDYIRCMTLDDNVDPKVYERINSNLLSQIKEYMDDPMTATTFRQDNSRSNSSETTTSELIYYWMITNNVPVEFENWHIKRLLTLLRVCSVKNQPAKKMSKNEVARSYRSLNAQRRAKLGTKG